MPSEIPFILNILKLQIDDIYTYVKRKKMNTREFARMCERYNNYTEKISVITDSETKYNLVNKQSQYLFNYLVRMLIKKSQKKGSREEIRVRNWHKGTVGYKNSLRNMMSSRIKNRLAEYFPLPWDPDNPAIINKDLQKNTQNNRTKWTIGNLSFVPEHSHILLLELAELVYPGIMILATEFEHIQNHGLQFTVALRLLSTYLDHVSEVIDSIYSSSNYSQDELLEQLEQTRDNILMEAQKLSLRYPRKNRMSQTEDTFEQGDGIYYASVEYDHLESILQLEEDQIMRIQKKATEQARIHSSRIHQEIIYLNEYPGNCLYRQLVDEPSAFEYTSKYLVGAEMRVYSRELSGSIDLVVGTYDNSSFLPIFLIDRKAVSRYYLQFDARSDPNKISKHIVASDLDIRPYGQDFGPLINSQQILIKERKYGKQLGYYHRAIQEIHPITPLSAILYYDLAYDVVDIARQEIQLILSSIDYLDMYQGLRLVISHPATPAVRLVLLGGNI